MELYNKIKWQDVFKYFVYLDKVFCYNKFTKENIKIKSKYKLTIIEKESYKLRFNKYLYLLEVLHTLLFNQSIFDTNSFFAGEHGVIFIPSHNNLSLLDLQEAKRLDKDLKTLTINIKKLCNWIVEYYGELNDEKLVNVNIEDPLWIKSWYNMLQEINYDHDKLNDDMLTFKLDNLLGNEKNLDLYYYINFKLLKNIRRKLFKNLNKVTFIE
ncbi:hypothetical protein SLITO_v1c10560 [Spiroplasma litorale]|uniref:Uncharacterized protein n=1 Tax=Spiroplasma litorale TaxID=216942 RepID=A0A0K1W3I2_9MOLU|nr:hypothetical protein [Spiroplasma litorale]AKX34667.1 hypothetical protein SLITO_v1c10560 [Spiroplasma litorale]